MIQMGYLKIYGVIFFFLLVFDEINSCFLLRVVLLGRDMMVTAPSTQFAVSKSGRFGVITNYRSAKLIPSPTLVSLNPVPFCFAEW